MIQFNTLSQQLGYNQIEKKKRITILLENTFNYNKHLNPNYLIEDNYRYLNNKNIIQIFIIDTKL